MVNTSGIDGNACIAPGKKTAGVWVCAYINSAGNIQTRRTTNNGVTWSAATTIVSGSSVIDPTLASDATGVMVIAYHSGFNVYVKRSTDEGATWGVEVPLPDTFGAADYSPAIETNGSGTYVVIHEAHAGAASTDYDIALNRSTDYGQTWSNEAYLNASMSSDGSFTDQGLALAAGSGGVWVATFGSTNTLGGTLTAGGYTYLMYSRSTDNGATWSNMAPVSTTYAALPGWPGYWPSIISDKAGNWVITHNIQTSGADFDTYAFRSSDNGATWSSRLAISPNVATDSADDRYPSVTTDGKGRWICTYSSQNTLGGTKGSDFDIVYTQSFDNGTTWTTNKVASKSMRTDTVSDISFQGTTAFDNQGNILASFITQPASDDNAAIIYGVSDVELTSTSLSFGSLDTDSPATTRDVVIANDGLTTLTFTGAGIEIVGADASQFSFVAAPDISAMAPGTSRSVTLRFDPSTAGAKSATFRVSTNDPNDSVINSPLTGTGIDQEITVVGGPHVYDPLWTLSGPSQPKSVTIQNVGSATLNFTSIAITGPNASEFIITSPATLPTSLAVGQSVVIEIVFDPNTAGAKSASLTIVSDDTDEGTVNVALSSNAAAGFNAAEDWELFH